MVETTKSNDDRKIERSGGTSQDDGLIGGTGNATTRKKTIRTIGDRSNGQTISTTRTSDDRKKERKDLHGMIGSVEQNRCDMHENNTYVR
jgi:hypothetical protein